MKKIPLSLSSLMTALIFCASANAALPTAYLRAVHDASIARQSEISNKLDAVTPSNNTLVWNADKTLLKVVTWKSTSDYENYILPFNQTSDNEAYVVWVTLAPRMQTFCRHYSQTHPNVTPTQLDSRLKKRLGLNPTWQYDLFVELWVSPADLFRPCVDPNIDDSSCNLNFGTTIPTVKNIKNYKSFYQNLYFNDFRSAPGLPWTGLGYTYDWAGNPAIEKGFSEFILSPSSPYTIEQAVPTMTYCAP